MTRKDFERLAVLVRSMQGKITIKDRYFLASELAKFCADSNQRFNHVLFFGACGVPNLWLKK